MLFLFSFLAATLFLFLSIFLYLSFTSFVLRSAPSFRPGSNEFYWRKFVNTNNYFRTFQFAAIFFVIVDISRQLCMLSCQANYCYVQFYLPLARALSLYLFIPPPLSPSFLVSLCVPCSLPLSLHLLLGILPPLTLWIFCFYDYYYFHYHSTFLSLCV